MTFAVNTRVFVQNRNHAEYPGSGVVLSHSKSTGIVNVALDNGRVLPFEPQWLTTLPFIKKGDKIRATLGETVVVGVVVDNYSFPNWPVFRVQINDEYNMKINFTKWNVEVLTPEVPERFKKQGATIVDDNAQYWTLFSHTENLWMSADGGVFHWDQLPKPVRLLEVVATYPPQP